MALSRSYEYEIIEEDLEVEEGEEPQTTTRKVLKYDYRGAINRCRAKPENQYKRKYLTRGGNYSGFVDFNNSYIQQFVSLSTPNKPNEVATPIGFFEYHVTPNEEVIQTIQIPATEPNATPEIIELKECYGTIVEMMSYTDEHFLEFGADLYYLLEHCFTEPIPREVYKSFHKSAQGTDIDAYLTTIPTLSRVEWLVFWDNPAEKLYDVLAVKMGGKIVMPQRKGQLKKYVITKEDFMNKVYRYNRD